MTKHSVRSPQRARIRAFAVALAAALLAAFLPGAAAVAKPGDNCDNRTNNTYRKLLECLTADGASEHLQAFQSFADANDDTRASGTAGYDASAEYVAETLDAAGYIVTVQEFEFPFFSALSPAELQILTEPVQDLETGTFEYSGSGDVTGNIVTITPEFGAGNASSDGCEASDFDGADLSGPNDIALIQRGACTFALKATNAQDAGAEAVIIFNQGNADGRFDLIVGTLGDQSAGVVTIPVVGASYDDGVALAALEGTETQVRVFTETQSEIRTTSNVIAESPEGDPDNVVMAGAHLDSVPEGPGVQDNGSGSAALIETALALAKLEPVNTLRFAWWGAEESGLIGSEYYVANLTDEERDQIAAYLNFDMIASPNYIYGVYDADESSFPAPAGVPIPEGSEALEDLFEIYYTWQGIPYEDSEFSGRSDYQAFILNDIPASGLFTGAEVAKTAEQEAIWGGIAGESYDQCYHQACDTFDNVSQEALGVNLDAVGFAILSLAYSTESVNGVPGKDVPGTSALDLPDEPAGPEGTVGSGGGLGHAHNDS
jgi:Zn-dependent M28 family amino/carboxypeptidase